MAAAPRFRPVFTAPADSYDRFMGKFSGPLAPLFCDFAGVEAAMRVLDVGCGPGRHSNELARRGIHAHGVDISAQFIDVGATARFIRLVVNSMYSSSKTLRIDELWLGSSYA